MMPCRRRTPCRRCRPSHRSADVTAPTRSTASRRRTAERTSGTAIQDGGLCSSSAPPAENGALRSATRDQVTGRLGVADADQPVAVEGERREAAQRAVALARVVQERRPSALSRVTQIGSWWETTTASWPVGAPRGRRAPRATSAPRPPCRARPTTAGTGSTALPDLRLAQDRVADVERLALEDVGRLDHPLVELDRETAHRGERRRGLLGALERRGDDVGDVAVADPVGDPLGHRAAALGEVEARSSGRRGCPAGCAPRRGAAGARSSSLRPHVESRRAAAAARPPRAGRRARAGAPGRRGRRRGTTPRTRSAAGRPPGRASRGRTPCRRSVSWLAASA